MAAGGTIESPVTKSAPSPTITTSTSTSTSTTPITNTTTTHTNPTIAHTTAAADVIVTHAAGAVFVGYLALPAKEAFTRRQRFRWSCAVGRVAVGRFAAPAGAIEGLGTVVRHSRRHMGIVGVSKGLGISFVMRERKNKRLQRSDGMNGQRGECSRTGPGRSGPTLPFRVVTPLANSLTLPYHSRTTGRPIPE